MIALTVALLPAGIARKVLGALGLLAAGTALRQLLSGDEKSAAPSSPEKDSEYPPPGSEHVESLCAVDPALYVNREAIYPRVFVDTNGEPLDGSCHYQIEGTIDTRAVWWAVTICDERFNLFPNMERHSFTSSNVATTNGGTRFVIDIGPEFPKGAANWLPCRAGEPFNLIWKLYMSGARVIEDPEHIEIPRVVNVMD